jgi:hypothetical protein
MLPLIGESFISHQHQTLSSCICEDTLG